MKGKILLVVFGFIAVAGVLSVFPPLRLIYSQFSTDGMNTVTKAGMTLLPYALFLLVGYMIYSKNKS